MKLLVLLYLVGFLRTLVVIALIYFGIRLFSRYVLPLLIDKGVKNMQQKMNEQQRQNRPRRAEGEVTIENNKADNRSQKGSKGEYVDFEEVD